MKLYRAPVILSLVAIGLTLAGIGRFVGSGQLAGVGLFIAGLAPTIHLHRAFVTGRLVTNFGICLRRRNPWVFKIVLAIEFLLILVWLGFGMSGAMGWVDLMKDK